MRCDEVDKIREVMGKTRQKSNTINIGVILCSNIGRKIYFGRFILFHTLCIWLW